MENFMQISRIELEELKETLRWHQRNLTFEMTTSYQHITHLYITV